MRSDGLLRLVGQPVRLEGDDLVRREWSTTDLDSMVELFDEPAIAYRTPLPSPFTRAEAQRRLDRAQDRDVLLLAVTVDGQRPLGEVMVTPDAHLAYMVGQQHRGRGLASRALLAAADYALLVLAAPVLSLEIEPDNGASAAVARRAGFQLSEGPEETVEDKGRTYTLQLWERRRTATTFEDRPAELDPHDQASPRQPRSWEKRRNGSRDTLALLRNEPGGEVTASGASAAARPQRG